MKHHHIVMTLPKAMRHLCNLNQKIIYDLLFKLSAQVLQEWFSQKHNIIPGIVSVLHTAGSDLKNHPHVHMIVSGGGLDLKSKRPKELKGYYLTRQRFLANKLKKAFITKLKFLSKYNRLKLPSKRIPNHNTFEKWLGKISDKQWIVSIQKPLEDLKQIVGYVGRYTKRACISEYKIQHIENNKIAFLYNDYKNTPRGQAPLQSLKTMNSIEFFDQLMQHVPDKRFRMVRYFGCYASHYKKQIPQNQKPKQENKEIELTHSWGEFEELRRKDIENGKIDPLECPNCKSKLNFEDIYFTKPDVLDDS